MINIQIQIMTLGGQAQQQSTTTHSHHKNRYGRQVQMRCLQDSIVGILTTLWDG